ncbi:MAG TPA: DoxX family membrane protein [Tepidisphaeraceae bacterium]|jgi:uncharacterized membrane protein|nr:DoxX family membrane protein [Tepidisphaeraceae bacterium]
MTPKDKWRFALRVLAAIGFVAAGANHFRVPRTYEQIIPPGYPSPRLLVQISGVAEIAGGVGLLIPKLRRSAGIGLIALLIAVFPANLFMATHPRRFGYLGIPDWVYWARLPFQLVFMAWVWFVAMPGRRRRLPA